MTFKNHFRFNNVQIAYVFKTVPTKLAVTKRLLCEPTPRGSKSAMCIDLKRLLRGEFIVKIEKIPVMSERCEID